MPLPNTYNVRLRWLKLNTAVDNVGDELLTHVFQQNLWASVEEETGRRQEEGGATQTGVEVTIRIRNYPAVQATDLLEDEYLAYVYHIDSIRNGDDEIILEGYRLDTLVDFNIGEDSDS